MRVTEELTDIEEFVKKQMDQGVFDTSVMVTTYTDMYPNGSSGPEMDEIQVEMEQAKRKFMISKQNRR